MWSAEAPSNIALIKYMGKAPQGKNVAANRSLSYTLGHLRTKVKVTASDLAQDTWHPLLEDGWQEVHLSPASQQRFLQYFSMLKTHFGLEGTYKLFSANNFPADCGLASSASSFAALTMAAFEVAKSVIGPAVMDQWTQADLSALSRQGSGSSCRSFYGPWCLWDEDGARSIDLAYSELLHYVVIVDKQKKAVSSSEAHKRIETSLLYYGRNERAQQRLDSLTQALTSKGRQEWKMAMQIVWAEFWDMHALFETSQPPFGYMTDKTLQVLSQIRQQWQSHDDGPIVTMDAGANVHLLFRPDQESLAETMLSHLSSSVLLGQSSQMSLFSSPNKMAGKADQSSGKITNKTTGETIDE